MFLKIWKVTFTLLDRAKSKHNKIHDAHRIDKFIRHMHCQIYLYYETKYKHHIRIYVLNIL